MSIDSPRPPPLPTRRSLHCYSCGYSSNYTTTSNLTPTLVCPSCHEQGFIVHSLTISRGNRGAHIDDWLVQIASSVSSRTKSTSKSFLKSLPSVRITEFDLKESNACSICMEDFVFGGSADKLPCKHLFHKSCIAEWLSRSNTCPLCRFKLPVEPRAPMTARPSTRSQSNLGDRLRVSSSISPGVFMSSTVIRSRRGLLGAESNTIARAVGGNSNMERGSFGSNTILDVVLDDDGDTVMSEDVRRDADGDIIMADA